MAWNFWGLRFLVAGALLEDERNWGSDASITGRVPYPGERLMQLLAQPNTGCFDLGALQEYRVM